MKELKYLIGIDPGINNLGMAAYCLTTKRIVLMQSGDFSITKTSFLTKMLGLDPQERWGFVLESPHLETNQYGGWEKVEVAIAAGNKFAIRSAVRVALSCAQDVGKNQAVAIEIERYADRLSIPTLLVKPSDRMRADYLGRKSLDPRFLTMPTKLDAKRFGALTGWKEKSNEHERDAAMLVWEKTERCFLTQIKFQVKK